MRILISIIIFITLCALGTVWVRNDYIRHEEHVQELIELSESKYIPASEVQKSELPEHQRALCEQNGGEIEEQAGWMTFCKVDGVYYSWIQTEEQEIGWAVFIHTVDILGGEIKHVSAKGIVEI